MKRAVITVLAGMLVFQMLGVALAFVPATGPEIDDGWIDLEGGATVDLKLCPTAQEEGPPTGPYLYASPITLTGGATDSSPLTPSGDNPFAPVGGDFNVTSATGLSWTGTGLMNAGVNAYGVSEMYMGGTWKVGGIPVRPGEAPKFRKARIVGNWWGIADFNGDFSSGNVDRAEARGFATAKFQEYDSTLAVWKSTGDVLWANWEGTIFSITRTASGFTGSFFIHMGDAPGTGFPIAADHTVKATKKCGAGPLPVIPGG